MTAEAATSDLTIVYQECVGRAARFDQQVGRIARGNRNGAVTGVNKLVQVDTFAPAGLPKFDFREGMKLPFLAWSECFTTYNRAAETLLLLRQSGVPISNIYEMYGDILLIGIFSSEKDVGNPKHMKEELDLLLDAVYRVDTLMYTWLQSYFWPVRDPNARWAQ